MMNKIVYVIFLTALLVSCKKENYQESPIELISDFENSDEQWLSGFADYPVGEDEFYELASGLRSLPEPLSLDASAFFLSGNNHSDDLFMFMKKKITGLEPSREYRITFNLDFASNAAEGSFGVGGSPANSVYIKAGASQIEPLPEIEPVENWFRMNIDKGNQSIGGQDMIVLGDFSNGTQESAYTMVSRSNNEAFQCKSNLDGELWLIIGVDSGFESTTAIYFDRIQVILE
jgi:hypothetical protein